METRLLGRDGSALADPEDVIPFLGRREKHWKQAFSAFEVAHSWFAAAPSEHGLPAAVRALLESEPSYAGARLTQAIFEKTTVLDGIARGESQTDVLAFVAIPEGSLVLGVEGKVNEPFGPRVSSWLNRSANRPARLAIVASWLGLEPEVTHALRYQLLHRAAAVLIEADNAGASDAALVVQSFSPGDVRKGFADFQAFAAAMGAPVDAPGTLSPPIARGAVCFRLGWTINPIYEAPQE